MDDPKGDGMSGNRRRGPGKRSATSQVEATNMAPPPSAPCGACKFLRRKCVSGCIFAPHFGSDQGAARFAAVHKVFGASNVSKLLSHIPANRRHDAVVTISYEAQARLSDPVYGCVSTIIALQQQVTSLQTELSVVQTQLINSRFVMENALQNSPQQQQQHIAMLQQPAYSNTTSSVSNNINFNNFTTNFGETIINAAPSNTTFDHPNNTCRLSRHVQDEEDEEEESHDDPLVFANHIFH
ncbi:hypothetical protein RD792_000022 [Penstemon davidsonii]|uniref:LOB domain-containing protein n=1 Tax=Penstemon davidsonii TaxID=160366 RepID=A0ABR0DUX1_9LAMI|nr:hypothetical protein RD792_000022 [Penstemon davidsonii]